MVNLNTLWLSVECKYGKEILYTFSIFSQINVNRPVALLRSDSASQKHDTSVITSFCDNYQLLVSQATRCDIRTNALSVRLSVTH